MTFDEYLEECKARDPEFAAGYDSGYALYEQLFKAKMAGQVTTLKVVLEPHQTEYLGFLVGSPPIQARGATLAEARANLAQEVVCMLDPEYVQVEGTATDEGSQSQETFVILTSSVEDLVKQEAANDPPKRKRGSLVQVG
jgi:hypothetical protein